jgi:hypothetical protein
VQKWEKSGAENSRNNFQGLIVKFLTEYRTQEEGKRNNGVSIVKWLARKAGPGFDSRGESNEEKVTPTKSAT